MRLIYDEDCKDLMYVMCAGQDKAFVRAMEQVIADCPSADAVPVVRCGECVEYRNGDCYHPLAYGMGSMLRGLEPTDFCSYGERKE